jgi:hypothetical protein
LRNGLFLVLVHVLVLVLEMLSWSVLEFADGFAAREFTVWDTPQTLEQEQDDREAGHALIASSKYYMERSVLVTAESSTSTSRSTRNTAHFATGSS